MVIVGFVVCGLFVSIMICCVLLMSCLWLYVVFVVVAVVVVVVSCVFVVLVCWYVVVVCCECFIPRFVCCLVVCFPRVACLALFTCSP